MIRDIDPMLATLVLAPTLWPSPTPSCAAVRSLGVCGLWGDQCLKNDFAIFKKNADYKKTLFTKKNLDPKSHDFQKI